MVVTRFVSANVIDEGTMFLRNAWYVAGWSHDFDQSLRAHTLLGEPIVFFRQSDGSPVALADRCPHRALPLSRGTLLGDHVECGYHGLTFDGAGQCVAAPTQPDRIPKSAQVRSYPVAERYRLLWIWMGDPKAADESLIFPVENFDNPDWGCTDGGVLDINCNYLWIVDNLLDPSHVAWVHKTSFAGQGTDGDPLEVVDTDRGVIVSRWIYGRPVSPYYANLVRFDGDCDRLQHYEMCLPAIALNMSVYSPVGTGGPDAEPGPATYRNISYNFMTPIDEDRTRYFWFQHRNTDPHDAAISKQMNDGAYMAFEEDRQVLERVHKGMKTPPSPGVGLIVDQGAQRFRRFLQQQIDAEAKA
jgi:phenylpropionate dioxygenase-like ring-hydroxylating dioxygenase large terminal subunit